MGSQPQPCHTPEIPNICAISSYDSCRMIGSVLAHLVLPAFHFVLNKHRVPLLLRFAEERGFSFREDLDAAQSMLLNTKRYERGHVRNAIAGTLEGNAFVYFEDVVSRSEIESVVAFESGSREFLESKPALFGFRSEQTNQFCFFWWDGYLVPLKEMDMFLRQGVKAFLGANERPALSRFSWK